MFFSSYVSVVRHCPHDEYQCNNTLCKPLSWKCDGEDDCGDNSDENPEECSKNTQPDVFSCAKFVHLFNPFIFSAKFIESRYRL